MSSISKALQKSQNAESVGDTSPADSAGNTGESAPIPASYPVSAIIRQASRRRAAARTTQEVRAEKESPSIRIPMAWIWALLIVTVGAVGVGFLFNTTNDAKRALEVADASTEAAVTEDESSSAVKEEIASAVPDRPQPTNIAKASPGTSVSTVLPQPAQNGSPIVVRVEFAPADASPAIRNAEPLTQMIKTADPTAQLIHAFPDESLPEIPPPPIVTSREPEVSAKPGKSAKAKLDDYKLDGIMWSAKNPAAMINDRIMEEGQKMGPLVVKKINKTSVIVELDGREFDLRQ